MDDLLKDAFAKLNWARGHLRDLDAEADTRVRDSRTHKFTHELKLNSGEFIIRWNPDPLPEEFGLRIGDVAHSLRSALDVSVWKLSANPESLKSPRPQFPIVTASKDWKGTPERQVRGLPQELQRVVHDNQPCFARNVSSEDPLALLVHLSNADKHRVITPVQVAVQVDTTHIRELFQRYVADLSDYSAVPNNRIVEANGEVARFRFRDPLQGPTFNERVEAEASADIALSEGVFVVPALEQVGIRVEGILRNLAHVARTL